MKYGIAFGIIAFASAFYALQYPAASLALSWASLSFAIVASAYIGILPRAFFKGSNGVIPVWSKLLNLPFLLYTCMIWHIYRLLSNESATNKVSDELVIGRRLLAKEVTEDYDSYVDLTAEFDEPRELREKPSYISFPILDASVPSLKDLISLLDNIENKKLFVHCAQGHGRTGLIALALLLRKGIVQDVSEGVAHLQECRPALNLNRNQIEYLELHREGITRRSS